MLCYKRIHCSLTNRNRTVEYQEHFRQSKWFTRGWTLQGLAKKRHVCRNQPGATPMVSQQHPDGTWPGPWAAWSMRRNSLHIPRYPGAPGYS